MVLCVCMQHAHIPKAIRAVLRYMWCYVCACGGAVGTCGGAVGACGGAVGSCGGAVGACGGALDTCGGALCVCVQRAHIPKAIMAVLEKDDGDDVRAVERAKKVEEDRLAQQEQIYEVPLSHPPPPHPLPGTGPVTDPVEK